MRVSRVLFLKKSSTCKFCTRSFLSGIFFTLHSVLARPTVSSYFLSIDIPASKAPSTVVRSENKTSALSFSEKILLKNRWVTFDYKNQV